LGQYTKQAGRLIPTYDDDFVLELAESEYRGTLYVNDSTLSTGEIADAIHRMSEQYPQDQTDGVVFVDQWL
jgi:hypothetical protein